MKYLRYIYRVSMHALDMFLIDDGWAIASHIALSALMAMFPFLIVLTALAGFFGLRELADQAAELILSEIPPGPDHPGTQRKHGGVHCELAHRFLLTSMRTQSATAIRATATSTKCSRLSQRGLVNARQFIA